MPDLAKLVGSIDGKLDMLIELHKEATKRADKHDAEISELKTRMTVAEKDAATVKEMRKDHRSFIFSAIAVLLSFATLVKGYLIR